LDDPPDSPTKSGRLSPSKFLQRVFHPHPLKRKRSEDQIVENLDSAEQVKRVRGGLQGPEFREMMDVDTSIARSARNTGHILDSAKTVKFFSLNQTRLAKNDQYQVLWFPLDDPMDDEKRRQRRLVTSERIL